MNTELLAVQLHINRTTLKFFYVYYPPENLAVIGCVDDLFELLHGYVSSFDRRNPFIIYGDFNARTGNKMPGMNKRRKRNQLTSVHHLAKDLVDFFS